MSDYPTIVPTKIKGYSVLYLKIKQTGTHRPIVWITKNTTSYPSERITASRIETGKYVINIPNSSNVVGAGIYSYSHNRLLQAEFGGTQMYVNCVAKNFPNSVGATYADDFYAIMRIYYKPSVKRKQFSREQFDDAHPFKRRYFNRFRHYSQPNFLGFKLHDVARDSSFPKAFSTFGTHIGAVNESTIINNVQTTRSRYVIKGLGEHLKYGFSVGAFCENEPTSNFYFYRTGNDLVLGVNGIESIDDETTWHYSPITFSDAWVFIQFNHIAR